MTTGSCLLNKLLVHPLKNGQTIFGNQDRRTLTTNSGHDLQWVKAESLPFTRLVLCTIQAARAGSHKLCNVSWHAWTWSCKAARIKLIFFETDYEPVTLIYDCLNCVSVPIFLHVYTCLSAYCLCLNTDNNIYWIYHGF